MYELKLQTTITAGIILKVTFNLLFTKTTVKVSVWI